MVTDMKQTIDCIVKASSLPLSIVIVGVGNTDFTAMVSKLITEMYISSYSCIHSYGMLGHFFAEKT